MTRGCDPWSCRWNATCAATQTRLRTHPVQINSGKSRALLHSRDHYTWFILKSELVLLQTNSSFGLLMTPASQIFQVISDAIFIQSVFIHGFATFPFSSKTVMQPCLSTWRGSLFFSLLSEPSLFSWHRWRKWLTPLSAVWRKIKTLFSKTCARTHTETNIYFYTFWQCFSFLHFKARSSLPEHPKLIYYWLIYFFLPKTLNTESKASTSWINLTLFHCFYLFFFYLCTFVSFLLFAHKPFPETRPTLVSFKLYANPCLDWKLTGFFLQLIPMT